MLPGRATVPTGGLPQLLSTLQPEESKRTNGSDGSGVIGWLVLLHVGSVVTLVAATLMATETSAFRGDALLVAGAVPSTFVSLCVTTICVQLAFTILSAIDAAYYLCTQVSITSLSLFFGILSTTFACALSVIASLQLRESLYWLWMLSTLCAGLALALQLATVLSILVKNNAPLLRAIRQSL